jgi:hypothetical protein
MHYSDHSLIIYLKGFVGVGAQTPAGVCTRRRNNGRASYRLHVLGDRDDPSRIPSAILRDSAHTHAHDRICAQPLTFNDAIRMDYLRPCRARGSQNPEDYRVLPAEGRWLRFRVVCRRQLLGKPMAIIANATTNSPMTTRNFYVPLKCINHQGARKRPKRTKRTWELSRFATVADCYKSPQENFNDKHVAFDSEAASSVVTLARSLR